MRRRSVTEYRADFARDVRQAETLVLEDLSPHQSSAIGALVSESFAATPSNDTISGRAPGTQTSCENWFARSAASRVRPILVTSSKLNSLRVQTKAKCLGDLKNGGKAWVAILTQRFVKTLAA